MHLHARHQPSPTHAACLPENQDTQLGQYIYWNIIEKIDGIFLRRLNEGRADFPFTGAPPTMMALVVFVLVGAGVGLRILAALGAPRIGLWSQLGRSALLAVDFQPPAGGLSTA
jgi:hypothetical protein